MPTNRRLTFLATIAVAVLSFAVFSLVAPAISSGQETASAETSGKYVTTAKVRSRSERKQIEGAIVAAFELTHEGWSSDEVILQSDLNQGFVACCQEQLADIEVEAAEVNWMLLNLRKAGKLNIKSTQRENRSYSEVTHIAEIAARMMEDKHSLSSDRVMANPVLRSEFDQIALNIDKEIDTYLVRKAAFKLRKTRKLKPELITRVADWDRDVSEHSAADLAKNTDAIPTHPGIYIFRDVTGYLYIGEADNLRNRLKTHLDESDRKSLANYLKANDVADITIEIHSFDPDSRAKELMVRRAYESELIRSRKPRFNIRP